MEISKHIPPEYDHERHIYSLNGERYLSSTQVVEKFQNPFNAREIAERYAAKHGGTAEYWMQEWAENRDRSLVRGNTIHDANETALQGRMMDTFNGRQVAVHGDAILEEDPWFQRPDGVYTERMLWHHGYKIAGRADKIIIETEHLTPHRGFLDVKQRVAHIEDYKTNKELKKESYRFASGNYKMMKPPLGHIMDCNWWHYQIQLSLYMFMLEYQGFKPGTMTVIHYPHDGAKQRHPVTYLKREVILALNYLR